MSEHPSDDPNATTRGDSRDAVGEGAIRRIFPMFVLTMWVVSALMVTDGEWGSLRTILMIEAALICAVVFVNFTYVFNYGYATSVVVLSATVLVVEGPSPAALTLGVLLIAYGSRLWAFTFRRYRSPGYAGTRVALAETHRSLPIFVKAFVYVQSATLFLFHAMALAALASTDARIEAWTGTGLALVTIGIVLEALADEQKQRAKGSAVGTFVRTGLFARTRHPNYLGEIVFQTGVAITGLTAVASVTTGLAVVLAPAYIVALMASMVLRGEASKRRRYADDPAFSDYLRASGALLPRFSPAR